MANTVAALLRISKTIVSKNFSAQTTNVFHKSQVIRHLYSQTTLGMDGYLQQKNRITNQLTNIAPKFREKMKEYTTEESKNMVFTEDLKNMLHLAENEEDLNLCIKMMKRFNQQNKQLRFGNYIFGPIVMRMFYYLNKPDEAFQCFKAPELEGFFDQLITYQILLDLLYERQKYSEILEAFQIIRDKQIEGIKFAKNVIVLTFAACYKMNTKETLEHALKIWSELSEIGHLPMRRATTFCAALALNQNRPDVALEILSAARNTNYTTVRNIRVAAMIAMGRIEDAMQILKSILHEDSAAVGPVQTFNKDILNQAKIVVGKLDNENLKLEFSRIEKYFQEQGHISETTLDEQLCQEIAAPPLIGRKFNDNARQFQYQRNPNSNWNSRERKFGGQTQRPGLADLL